MGGGREGWRQPLSTRFRDTAAIKIIPLLRGVEMKGLKRKSSEKVMRRRRAAEEE